MSVNSYNNYISKMLAGHTLYDLNSKERCMIDLVNYGFIKTNRMFTWSGLPDTIPSFILELYLQYNGNVCFYEHNGKLYVFVGGLGGEPNVYYMPTIYTIANPALNLSVQTEIDKDCIVIPNDSLYMGLLPIHKKYATLQVESELSLRIAIINSRIIDLISAPDDTTFKSAKKYLEDVEQGKLGVIADNAFLDGVKTQPYGSSSRGTVITSVIESLQYVRATWLNEIGLNANYNMKREALNTAETGLNEDGLKPLIDDMLEHRKIGAEKVNTMFGTNISVELSETWKAKNENENIKTSNTELD